MKSLTLFLFSLLFVVDNQSANGAVGLPAAPDRTFSIVVIPDTQHYKGRGTKADREKKSTEPVTNSVFAAYTDWIVANLERQRIVFVSHVGDIVDRNNREQWAVARGNMDKFHGQVP